MRQFMKTECRREAGEAMGFPLSRSVVGGCREATKSRRRGGGGPLRLGEHVFRVVAQRCSQVRQLNLRGVGAGRPVIAGQKVAVRKAPQHLGDFAPADWLL